MGADERFPCPACGFLVFDEPPGSYDICSVCGWEDDHVQLAHPTMRGGANGESLVEAQAAVLREIPVGILKFEGESRDPHWRPLREDELVSDRARPRDGKSYFTAALKSGPAYYWRTRD